MQTLQEYKVVVLGDSGVGKTSFIARFVKRTFDGAIETTAGASFLAKTLEHQGREVKFNIWDTAGQERYHALAKIYYRDAAAVILVYDITRQASFAGLTRWMSELRGTVGSDVEIVVVGNKEDLVEREEVDTIEAKQFADENRALFCKTSAKTNFGVDEVFQELLTRLKPTNQKRQASVLQPSKSGHRKGCCG